MKQADLASLFQILVTGRKVTTSGAKQVDVTLGFGRLPMLLLFLRLPTIGCCHATRTLILSRIRGGSSSSQA